MLSKTFIFDLTQGSLKNILFFLKGHREIDLQVHRNSIWLYFFDSALISISELEYHLYYIRFYDYYVSETEGPIVTSFKYYRDTIGRFESLIIYSRDRDNPDKMQELKQMIHGSYNRIKDLYNKDPLIDDSDMGMELFYDGINPFRQYFIRSNSYNTTKEPSDIYIIDSEPRYRPGANGKKPYDMLGVSLITNDQIKFFIMSFIPPGGSAYGRRYFIDLMRQSNKKALFFQDIFSLFNLRVNELDLIPELEISDEILRDFNFNDSDNALEYLYVYYDEKGVGDSLSYLRNRLKKYLTSEFQNEIKFTTVTRNRKQLRNEYIYSIDQIYPLD